MNSSKSHSRTQRRSESRRSASRASAPDARTVAKLIRAAVENVAAPLFICEVEFAREIALGCVRILHANPASKELTGSDPNNLIGRDLIPILIPEADSPMRDCLHALLRQGRPATIPDLRAGAGHEYELHAFPLRSKCEQPAHWSFLLHDMTAEHERDRRWELREDELEELVAMRTAELEASQEALRRSERLASMGTLVAGLGHDLNNLLFPVRGHLAALDCATLDDGIRIHVKAIGQATEYLRQLNDNLRLFAMDPERRDDARGVTDIGDWWSRLRTLLEHAIRASVELRVDLPQNLPPVGVCSHRLTQAVLNLLINASEAITDSGTIRLWANVADDHGFVRLGVTDSGRGMSAEVRSHAIEPFFTTKQRERGTGLGLSLVHGIVSSIGGRIEIDSKPRRGTTIVLNLPIASDHALACAAARKESATATVTIGDRRIGACFEALLVAAGFTVQPSTQGDPAPVDIWVTEPSASALRAARKLRVLSPDCRIVLFGEGAAEWLSLGVSVVDREGGLSAMRATLAEAMSAKK